MVNPDFFAPADLHEHIQRYPVMVPAFLRKKYRLKGEALEDAVQEAYLHLIRAIPRFNPDIFPAKREVFYAVYVRRVTLNAYLSRFGRTGLTDVLCQQFC